MSDEQCATIRDDTVWRAEEREAWFELLSQLRDREPRRLLAESSGEVGYSALFRQSEVYRGRLVTVRGTAQMAYRVNAPENDRGIGEYCVFWVRPAGGPSLPMVVYALQLPAGFPEVENKDRTGKATTLNEDVEFVGFFFKRWAYRAKDGINTAPLLLAREPIWSRDVGKPATLPSAGAIALWVCAVAVFSTLLAVWAYRQTRVRRPRDRT